MRTGSHKRRGDTPALNTQTKVSGDYSGSGPGHIYIVGLGPGDEDYMCDRARQCLKQSEVIIGYKTYLSLIEHIVGKEQEVISSGMTREVERCEKVLELAEQGKTVSLISSGDPGVYGMAGVMYQTLHQRQVDIPIEVVPGISAANAAAASLGAPLMHDYVCISLSDLLTPWSTILKRVECAAQGDFVIAIYNPKSKQRTKHIEEVRRLLLETMEEDRPVGIVRNAKRGEEEVIISNLKDFTGCEIDMFTTVIIGNSQSYVKNGKLITPRGYQL